MNPQHNVPFFKDGDFQLGESVAINIYLGETYGKNNPDLYPTEVKAKAKVNQRLMFVNGCVWEGFLKCFVRGKGGNHL